MYKGLEMNLNPQMEKRLIFSELFILQNKIQTKFDKVINEITSKQFIILMITKSFHEAPSLTEVANHAGCSRQNVKKIAVVLEQKGFVKLMPEKGTRAIRIHLQDKFYAFFDEFMNAWGGQLEILFQGMDEQQIHELFVLLHLMEENVERLGV